MKLVLSPKAILEKGFDGVKVGYSPIQVDRFLDQVSKDYVTFEAMLNLEKDAQNELLEQIRVLHQNKRELEVELNKYKTRFSNIKDADNVSSNNIVLLKRINALEKYLHSIGVDPNTIK